MDFRPFDFDNHYYEAPDAFTRYLDRSFANRGVRWAEIDGRRRLLVAGTVNNYVANPTFDPVSRPGALFDWYRGNPQQVGIRDAFGELEPLRAEYHDRDARLEVVEAQGLGGVMLFPTLAVGIEEPLARDPEAVPRGVPRLQPLARRGLGLLLRGTALRGSVHPAARPRRGGRASCRPCSTAARSSSTCATRRSPCPAVTDRRSIRVYDGFWGLAADAGVVVATHAGLDGYSVLVDLGNRAGPSPRCSALRCAVSLTKGRAVSDFYGAALCQRIFERFPGLRMASVENGAGWVPDLLHRVDDAANRNPGYFGEHPRDVFRERVWVTPFWEDASTTCSPTVPVERLLMGSDWPHAEGVRQPARLRQRIARRSAGGRGPPGRPRQRGRPAWPPGHVTLSYCLADARPDDEEGGRHGAPHEPSQRAGTGPPLPQGRRDARPAARGGQGGLRAGRLPRRPHLRHRRARRALATAPSTTTSTRRSRSSGRSRRRRRSC